MNSVALVVNGIILTIIAIVFMIFVITSMRDDSKRKDNNLEIEGHISWWAYQTLQKHLIDQYTDREINYAAYETLISAIRMLESNEEKKQ